MTSGGEVERVISLSLFLQCNT